MHKRHGQRKSSYVVMLMLITLGNSRRVVNELDYLYSSTSLLLIDILNARSRWNLPYLVRRLFPRQKQWSAYVASVTSYA